MSANKRNGRDDRITIVAADVPAPALRVLNGPEAGRILRPAAMPCRLGRGGASDLLLADPHDPPALSREHATLARPAEAGGAILVTDHSRNGTTAGERLLASGEAALLRPGGILCLGPGLRLLYQPEAGSESSAATIAENPMRGAEAPRQHPASPPALCAAPSADLRALITSPAALQAAWQRVALNRGGAGADNVSIGDFARDAERRLDALRGQLVHGRYEPLPARLFAAPKRSGGVRTISILAIQDRVVQHALHAALQPHLEPHFPPCSYAYRPGVSAHHALRAVDAQLARGFHWVGETDIARFFDTIRHDLLLAKLRGIVPDPFVLSLAARCLAAGGVGGAGLAQGAATSPLFSNLYLAEFDAHMLAIGHALVRYGDDLLLACRERGKAQAALSEAEGFLRARLGLTLKAEKTGVASLEEGFTFLGFRFNQSGRQPAPRALENLAARLEEAPPAQAPAVLRGWQNYFGAPPPARLAAEAGPPPALDGDARAALSAEEMERFLELFGGREDTHARQTRGENGRLCFTACTGPLTADHLRSHLSGQETVATYLVRRDGRVGHIVLDIDISSPVGRPGAAALAPDPAELRPAVEFAGRLRGVCREFGVPVTLEDSGRRGRHLWLFFSEPVAAESARRLGRLLALRAGFPRAGIRLEILPRHAEWPGPELGDAVKLPFGVHPLTGRRCFVLDDTGEPIAEAASALERARTLPAARLPGLLTALARDASPANVPTSLPNESAESISRLLTGCSVLRGLVDRAGRTGHLRHTHQLILLYTAGRLGEEGAAFLHRTIAHCHNYRPEICQGYIDRLEREHPPLTCRRIREWLEEEGETGLCTCAHTRRTPLDGIVPPSAGGSEARAGAATAPPGKERASKTAPLKPRAAELAESDWREVAADIFGETARPEGEEQP